MVKFLVSRTWNFAEDSAGDAGVNSNMDQDHGLQTLKGGIDAKGGPFQHESASKLLEALHQMAYMKILTETCRNYDTDCKVPVPLGCRQNVAMR